MKKRVIHYDPRTDVMAVYIGNGREEEFVEIAPNIGIELDKRGKVIGIEILNASRVLRPILRSLKQRQAAYA